MSPYFVEAEDLDSATLGPNPLGQGKKNIKQTLTKTRTNQAMMSQPNVSFKHSSKLSSTLLLRDHKKWYNQFCMTMNLRSSQSCSRLEKLNIRSSSTQVKVMGTLVCISGALVATLYKGPQIWTPSSLRLDLFAQSPPILAKRKNKLLGGVFLFTSGICVSFWNILQVKSMRTQKS